MTRRIERIVCIILMAYVGMSTGVSFAQDPTIRYGQGVPAAVRIINDRGLRYLADTQEEDGSWSDGTSGPGITGICVMALMASGEDPDFGPYATNIRKALRNIIANQNAKTGYISGYSVGHGSMYHHGFALLALSEAYGVVSERLLWEGSDVAAEKRRSLAEALELGVRASLTAQKKNPWGAWRYSPEAQDADTTVAGTVLMGVLGARNAGIEMAKGDILVLNDADALPVPDFIAQHVKSHHSRDSAVVIGGKYDMLARWHDKMYSPHLDALLNVSGHFKEVRENVARARQGQASPFIFKEDIWANPNRVQQYVFRKSYHNWDSVYHVYSETLDDFVIPWILCVTINVSFPKALIMTAGLFDESFVGWGLEDAEMGYRLHQCGAKFVYNEAATNYHQLHPNDYPKRWREHARNYKRFCQKHPALEVYLQWRFAVGLMSAKAYNEIVKGFYRLRDSGYNAISQDYLALSKELAEIYGQDEVFLSRFPRPVPESLQIN